MARSIDIYMPPSNRAFYSIDPPNMPFHRPVHAATEKDLHPRPQKVPKWWKSAQSGHPAWCERERGGRQTEAEREMLKQNKSQ